MQHDWAGGCLCRWHFACLALPTPMTNVAVSLASFLLCRDAPPLTVAAVHVKTVVNPANAANEIVAASVVYLQRVRTDGPMAQVRHGHVGIVANTRVGLDGFGR